jgi:hypothetical protein
MSRNVGGMRKKRRRSCGTMPQAATPCDRPEPQRVLPRGGEHTDESAQKTGFSPERGTVNHAISPDLADVLNAWPSLPESFRAAIRAGVLAMIKALKADK